MALIVVPLCCIVDSQYKKMLYLSMNVLMFHAVQHGWFRGVFLTQKTAVLATYGFQNAKYQQFFRRDFAHEYVFGEFTGCGPGYQIVYTDGSYRYNTKRAGYGVYFGKGDARNACGYLANIYKSVNAEAAAVVIALLRSGGDLEIRTDCLHLIFMVAFDRQSTQPENALISLIRRLCVDRRIKWTHVHAHSGVVGNDVADSLARLGSAPLHESLSWWRTQVTKNNKRSVFSLDLKTYLEALLISASVVKHVWLSCTHVKRF